MSSDDILSRPTSAAPGRRGTLHWPGSPADWRLIPRIDQNPGIIAFAQTIPGCALLIASFTVLFVAMNATVPSSQCLASGSLSTCLGFRKVWLLIPLLAAASAYAGKYRWHVVPICTLIVLLANDFWFNGHLATRLALHEGVESHLAITTLRWTMPAAVLAFAIGAILSVRRYPTDGISRRPVAWLIAFFAVAVLMAASPLQHGVWRVVMWSFLATLTSYFWFIGYALREAKAGQHHPLTAQFGTFRPFWGSTGTPFGKGVTYLRKLEAANAHDLAVTQLKGLKLALWVVMMRVALTCLMSVGHGTLAIPTFDEAFARQVAGDPYPWFVGWTTLVLFFFEDLLAMAIFGGVFVACARLAGFRLLRNTYRPLQSQTIADFWNRYYFYYKELLVDFFFHPTYLACFRKHKALRLAFATFMAACVGNMIFHFMRDIYLVAELGMAKAVIGYQSHAFYTFVLALGIIVSQLRRRESVEPPSRLSRAAACLRVALFFCILHIFDAPLDREHTLGERFLFLFHILGINP